MDKFLEVFVGRMLRRGDLEIETASGRTFRSGDGTGPRASIRFIGAAAQLRFLADPELAFGELYMEGLLSVTRGTIYDVLLIAATNIHGTASTGWLKLVQRTRNLMRRLGQRNNLLRAASHVSHHYDIDPRLYALFLDSDRQYSCAYFERPTDSLEDAQLAKKRHIAAKLLIEPGQSVLDIGCGWGGLGLYLSQHCEARVTGVTLSKEQLTIGRGRAAEAQLDAKVEFRLQDYRDVPEVFDRIVSVGMFEHVGVGDYDTFFKKIYRALKSDGVALVHTIGRPDRPAATNPWILKYIFPGGSIPSMSEVLAAIERARLTVTDVEVMRVHYAETLKAWRERFHARRDEALALYDERFCRMWEYYLAGSEASFRAGDCVVFQFQLSKKVDVVPRTRDYIADRERHLRARDGHQRRLQPAAE